MSDKKDPKPAIEAAIRKAPTASDEYIAAQTGAAKDVVSQVRAEMGAKHTWPQEKEDT